MMSFTPVACLTGDIHHASLGTGNQKHCDISEVQVARRFVTLLEEFDIKATFFVSGKTLHEEWEDFGSIAEHPLVELGGHNWSCFTPELWHRGWNKLIGSYNGPAWYQKWDVVRTMRIIERKTGKKIRSWRNHMYMHGPFTERVLAECGIELCSDGVKKNAVGPEWHPDGVFNFPLNVIPDHEHLYHAERTPEWVKEWQKRYGWSDDFGPQSYYIEEWVEHVLGDLRRNRERGAITNMIIHPITMYLCDRFKGVRRVLEELRKQPCVHLSEVLEQHARNSPGAKEQPT